MFKEMKVEGDTVRDMASNLGSNNDVTKIKISGGSFTIGHRASSAVHEVPLEVMEVKKPTFSNLSSDQHLMENLNLYSRFCEAYKIPRFQMANSLARAIGIQNCEKSSVMVYDYLLAIPEYPPTVNGRKEALIGEGKFCNMICYKNTLFGVVVFPSTEHVTFYFPEFSSYTVAVQHFIFSYGNKTLRYCPEKNALAFDFKPPLITENAPTVGPILLTATLKRSLDQGAKTSTEIAIANSEANSNNAGANYHNNPTKRQKKEPEPEYIQLE